MNERVDVPALDWYYVLLFACDSFNKPGYESLFIKCCRSLRHLQTVSLSYQWPGKSVRLAMEKMIQTGGGN